MVLYIIVFFGFPLLVCRSMSPRCGTFAHEDSVLGTTEQRLLLGCCLIYWKGRDTPQAAKLLLPLPSPFGS